MFLTKPSQSLPIKFILLSLTIMVLANMVVWLNQGSFSRKTELSGRCPNCNIVIIDIDSLRADALGCGSEQVNTPNICSFAREATYFQNNISQSHYTVPSFFSSLTSLYPTSHNMWHILRDRFSPEASTLPELLVQSGYKTAFIASSQEAIKELARDSRFSQFLNTGSFFAQKSRLAQITSDLATSSEPFLLYIFSDELHYPYLLPAESRIQISLPVPPPSIPTEIPKNREKHAEALAEYIAAHYEEIFKPEAIRLNPDLFQGNRLENKWEIYSLFKDYKRKNLSFLKDVWRPHRSSYEQYLDLNNPEHIDYLRANYIAALASIDEALSYLLALLAKPDIAGNTIVVIKSEHGEEFYEHQNIVHENYPYQELIRTPLIIKLPLGQARKVSEFSQDIDILPTLLDIVGLKIPLQAQGKSLLPLITGEATKVNNHQIAQENEGLPASFRKDDWKIIIKKEGPPEIYNLVSDPGEKNNLLAQNQELALQLLAEYNQIIERQKIYFNPESAFPEWVEEEKRQRLIEEGYF